MGVSKKSTCVSFENPVRRLRRRLEDNNKIVFNIMGEGIQLGLDRVQSDYGVIASQSKTCF
jgi:hypothetical protein